MNSIVKKNEPLVSHASIELTYQCNLKCSHCYANSGPNIPQENEISFDTYVTILKELHENGCASVQYIGGEPTTHSSLEKLITVSHEIGFSHIEVYTNLVSVKKAVWDAVRLSSASIASSFYSYDEAVHDSMTGKKGSWANTLGNIKKCVNLGIPLRVSVIEGEMNSDTTSMTVKFLHEHGVENVSIDYVRSVGRMQNPSETPAERAKHLCGHCTNGSINISPQGILFPCIMSKDWEIASLQSSMFGDIMKSGKIEEIRRTLSDIFHEIGKTEITNACGPEDKCSPKACKPQVGGPPGCTPKTKCAPYIFG